MEYKVSIVLIADRFTGSEKMAALIRKKKTYRLTVSTNLPEAIEHNRRKRIDLLLISSELLENAGCDQTDFFFNLHPTSVAIVCGEINTKNPEKTVCLAPCVTISTTCQEHEFYVALNNANEIAKLKNQISKDKSEIVRLLYQIEKMRRQSGKSSYNDISSIDLTGTDQNGFANLAEDLAISGSLAKVFNQINNFNLKKIATTLENSLPEVLKIRKFSIFLLKDRLSKLELFASFNFPIQKKADLEINSLMESSIMFDAIFQRKVIHINDYASSEFSKNQEESSRYEHNNCLCIPLVSGKKIIGVANFNDSQYGKFSLQQVNLILIFANYLAVILDNLHKKG